MALDLSRTVPDIPAPARAAPGWRELRRPGGARRQQFTEQLALLLETGMALVPALHSIAAQTEHAGLAGRLHALIEKLEAGSSFAEALASDPDWFPSTFVTVVRAAEEGGYLQRALRHLFEADEQRAELRAMLAGALSYPVFLLLFSFAVVLFILAVVFPKFSDLFAGIAADLPLSTRVLLGASDIIVAHHVWLFPMAVVCAGGAISWVLSARGRDFLLNRLETAPLSGNVMLRFNLVQTMRTLSLSLRNGVPLPAALEGCREVVSSPRFRDFIEQVLASVRDGRGLNAVISQTRWLPPMARQMLATGEQAGELSLVSGRIADHYQVELKRQLQTLGRIIEPALLLVMGAVVGLIVSSLILPIFRLAGSVH